MSLLADLAPWIAVLGAAVLGILLGLCVSVTRVCRKVRVAPEPQGEERPWECVEVLLRFCGACGARGRPAAAADAAGGRGGRPKPGTALCKASLVAAVASLTVGCGSASLALAIVLRVRLQDLQANAVGDPEKVVIDECMRDFEGLPLDDAKYQEQLRLCVQDLDSMPRLRWLPRIRLAVDERICEPESLCRPRDPKGCADEGTPLSANYRPGRVSQCYELIERAKAERGANRRAELHLEAERRCTDRGAWAGYREGVRVAYCMWKHMSTGVCMNSMRTNCPKDSSCCPVAQNYAGGSGQRQVRPDQYVCGKSPTLGLFCQWVDDRVPGNESERPMCTAATCPSFGWCGDLADVPGLCLGEACRAYGRALDVAVVVIVFVSLGLLADFADVVMLARALAAPRCKAATNAAGACLKLVAYLFCTAGGIVDFVEAALGHECFNAEGRERALQARNSAQAFRVLALLAMAGSFVLSPLSVRWGNRLVGLPQARSRHQPP